MDYCPFLWRKCPNYFMEYSEFGSRISNTQCKPCPFNTFFNQQAQACVPWTNCYVIYEYISKNGTIFANRECAKCEGDAASTTANAFSCDSTMESICKSMRGV